LIQKITTSSAFLIAEVNIIHSNMLFESNLAFYSFAKRKNKSNCDLCLTLCGIPTVARLHKLNLISIKKLSLQRNLKAAWRI
tara:strand:+ start:38301 stop:38546 length:246 start_codon:yes stop_codon:yes gene_type:complete